jgi:hypothetical protein
VQVISTSLKKREKQEKRKRKINETNKQRQKNSLIIAPK